MLFSHQFTYLHRHHSQGVYVRKLYSHICWRSASLCRTLVASHGELFLTEGEIWVLSCFFSVFDAGGSVCVCMCVYAHTRTHCTWGNRCEPRVRDVTPTGPEHSRWTRSRHICIRTCVQSTHVYIYAGRRDEIFRCLVSESTPGLTSEYPTCSVCVCVSSYAHIHPRTLTILSKNREHTDNTPFSPSVKKDLPHQAAGSHSID